MELASRTASALKWSASSQLIRQALQLLTTLVLARMLHPADFGLLGMAMVVVGFVSLFREFGTSSAVIKSRQNDVGFLSSVFWLNLAAGAVIAIVLVVSAPALAVFYREPRVADIVRVLSIHLLISSAGILQQALLERELGFQTLAKVEVASIVIGAVVGISLAVAGYGVWSLVFQTLCQSAMLVLMLWMTSSWRPALAFHWRDIGSVRSFGLNLTGFSIVNYIFRNIDNLLIGRYLGSRDLGYYNLAYRAMFFPLQAISDVIGRVMFPVYAHVQEDHARLRRYYLRATSATAFVTFPIVLGLMAVAEPFVLTIFGEKWRGAIALLLILAPVGLIQSIGTTVGSIYVIKARTDLMLRWSVGAGSVVTVAVLIGLPWGVEGVALCYAIAAFLLAYPGLIIPYRLIDLRFSELVLVLARPLLNAILMATAITIVRSLLPANISAVSTLVICVTAGIAVYWLLSYLFNRAQMIGLIQALKTRGVGDER